MLLLGLSDGGMDISVFGSCRDVDPYADPNIPGLVGLPVVGVAVGDPGVGVGSGVGQYRSR